ncbi:MAG: class II aldolase/adducin family protein [archaeon]|nr:class II aldolase/adducin family protein [archaeon]
MNETFARELLVDTCVRLYDRNLTVSTGGNISLRLNDNEILITPSGKNKGFLFPENIVKMSMDGKIIGDGIPSMENKFHLALYNKNNEVNAVIHCHPIYCTTLAVKGKRIINSTPEGVFLLGNIPMIDYFVPGSDELVDAVMSHSSSKAMIMKRHGALTQGKNMEEAYNRMEELEFQAHLQILAGRVKKFSKFDVEKLMKM